MNITQFFEMMAGTGTNEGGTSYTLRREYAVRLDTSKFDGTVEYYFEANMYRSGAGADAYCELYNLTDGASVSGSELVTSNNADVAIPIRSGALSLSGDKVYAFRIKNANGSSYTNIYGARIVIKQSGTITKTQVQIPIGQESLSVTSTSDTNLRTGYGRFLYEASKWDGIVSVRHDSNLCFNIGSGTATSGLYDETGAAKVSSSEVSNSTTSYVLTSSAAITLTDGHVYAPTAYVNTATGKFTNNYIVITLEDFTKFQTYRSLLSSNFTSTTSSSYGYDIDHGGTYDDADFGGGVTTAQYFEADISVSSGAQTVTGQMAKVNSIGNPSTYTDNAESVVTLTGTTSRTRVRSSQLTPLSDGQYGIGLKVTGGATGRMITGFFILEVSLPTTELMETLIDNFNDASLDSGKWSNYEDNGTIVETDVLTFTPAPSTSGAQALIFSNDRYNLTGSFALLEVLSGSHTGVASYLVLQLDGSNQLEMGVSDGNLYSQKKVGGSTTPLTNVTYNSTTHKWWRIREAGGTIYWDYSSDGENWNNLETLATPFDLTTLQVSMGFYEWGTPSSPDLYTIDNFNNPPEQLTITKSLKYTVKTPITKTKTLIYSVKDDNTITKSLIYKVAASITTQKTLIYLVEASISITKSLKYTVFAGNTIQKSLKYSVKTSTTLQAGLIYKVNVSTSITKSLGYKTKSGVAIEKTLIYATTFQGNLETDQFEIVFAVSETIQLDLVYKVNASHAIQKSLKYTVFTPQEVTKDLNYFIVLTDSITKSLAYSVRPSITITESLKYTVLASDSIQKSLKYTLFLAELIQKSLTYSIRLTQLIQKQLIYSVLVANSIAKDLVYKIKSPNTLTKSLKYAILTSTDLTKSLIYSVLVEATIQKSLKYSVITQTTNELDLRYLIKSAVTVQKSLTYSVLAALTIQDSLKYTVLTSITLERDLRYATALSVSITKSLKYRIDGEAFLIQISLKYAVVAPKTVTKSLKYVITTFYETSKVHLQHNRTGGIIKPQGEKIRLGKTSTKINLWHK